MRGLYRAFLSSSIQSTSTGSLGPYASTKISHSVVPNTFHPHSCKRLLDWFSSLSASFNQGLHLGPCQDISGVRFCHSFAGDSASTSCACTLQKFKPGTCSHTQEPDWQHRASVPCLILSSGLTLLRMRDFELISSGKSSNRWYQVDPGLKEYSQPAESLSKKDTDRSESHEMPLCDQETKWKAPQNVCQRSHHCQQVQADEIEEKVDSYQVKSVPTCC